MGEDAYLHFFTQAEALATLAGNDHVTVDDTSTTGCSVYVYGTPVTAELSLHVIAVPVCTDVSTPAHTCVAGAPAVERITMYDTFTPLDTVTRDHDNVMPFAFDVSETTGATVGEKVAPAN